MYEMRSGQSTGPKVFFRYSYEGKFLSDVWGVFYNPPEEKEDPMFRLMSIAFGHVLSASLGYAVFVLTDLRHIGGTPLLKFMGGFLIILFCLLCFVGGLRQNRIPRSTNGPDQNTW